MFMVFLVLVCSILIGLAYTSYQMDFRAYYIAAKSFVAGLNPYENNLLVSDEYVDPGVLRQNSKFIYPQPSLLFLSPLALFSYKTSKIIFSGIVLVVLLASFFLLKKRFPINDAVFLLLLLSFPVLANFERGQVDIIILFLILTSYYQREKWYAPLFLAVAISVKLIPCLLLIYYVVLDRNVRYVLKVIGFTMLTFGMSMLVMSTSIYLGFFYRLLSGFTVDPTNVFTMPENYNLIGRIIVTPDGVYNYTHSFVHKSLNPLFSLGAANFVLAFILIGITVSILKRKSVDKEEAFFILLIVIMSANRLLWIMGMVYYLPLVFLYMRRFTSLKYRFLILLPLIFPKNPLFPVFNFSYNFIIALFVVYLFTLSRTDNVEDSEHEKIL